MQTHDYSEAIGRELHWSDVGRGSDEAFLILHLDCDQSMLQLPNYRYFRLSSKNLWLCPFKSGFSQKWVSKCNLPDGTQNCHYPLETSAV